MPKLYLYYSGIKEVAKKYKGSETIHLGIRPYGFHAGNVLSLIVYPYLLCEEMRKLKKEPKFNLIYSINDWEQDEMDSPNKQLHPFNLKPLNTTIQFLPYDNGTDATMAEVWSERIAELTSKLLRDFPHLNLRFIRNSWLKEIPEFQELLLETLKNPQAFAEIFGSVTKKEILANPVYAAPVCKRCNSARNKPKLYTKKTIGFVCERCGFKQKGLLGTFNFWWYHKPLFLARMKIFKPDLALSGGDHFNEGDFEIRKRIAAKFMPGLKLPDMLFTPVLLTPEGQRMSKTAGNAAYGSVQKLIKLARNNNKPQISSTGALLKEMSYEKYSVSF